MVNQADQTGRGKLGQQAMAIAEQEQVRRPTRTERVAVQEQERVAKYDFETGKAEAKRLQEQEFIDKTYEEAYTHSYQVPKRYIDRRGNILQSWWRLTDRQRANILRSTSARNLQTFTEQRTRTKEVPFTFDMYKEAYEQLAPNVKQFFASPQEITDEKARLKEVDIGLATGRIETWQDRMERERERQQNYDDWWNRYTRSSSFQRLSSERQAERRAEYRRRMREYDNRISEYRMRIRYLQQQWGKIGEGYKLQDIINYATDKAYYDYQRWEGTAQARFQFELGIAKGDENLMKSIETLGLDKSKVTFTQFQASAKDFNKQLARVQSLQAWGGQVGFENLPEHAQKEIKGFLGLPKGEIPTFDQRGRLTQVQSLAFDGTFSPQDYETRVAQFQTKVEDAGGWDAYQKQLDEADYKKIIFDEEEDERRRKGIFDLKGFAFVDDPMGQRGTISTDYTGQVLMATDPDGTPTGFLKSVMGATGTAIKPIWKKGVEGFKWVDDRVYLGEGTGIGLLGKPIYEWKLGEGRPIKFGYDEDRVILRDERRAERKLSDTEKWDLRDEGFQKMIYGETPETFITTPVGKDLETKHTEIYEREFYKTDIGRELFFTDFETEEQMERAYRDAQIKFTETETGKKLQREYEKEFGIAWEDHKKDLGWQRRWGGAIGEVGLGLGRGAEGLVKSIDTPSRVAGTGVLVYGGWKGIGALPSFVKTGISAGFTTFGTIRALDPTRTDIERVSGGLIATIGAIGLTKAGITYMKAPTTKTVAIASKPTLKATQTIGKDVKFTRGADQIGNKVMFQSQKLSQIGVEGRRTVISQRWREAMNWFSRDMGWTARVDPVYKGVPAWQPAQYMKVAGLRETTLIKTAPSGYERAFKLLKQYGATDYQARATLRFHAPRVYEGWLKSGVLNVGKKTARGTFMYELRQPQLDLGAGIKTRAGRTVQDIFKVQRRLIEKDQIRYVREISDKQTYSLVKDGLKIEKGTGHARSLQLVSVSDTKKGWELLRTDPKLKTTIFQEGTFKELKSIAKDKLNIYISPTKAEGIRINIQPTEKAQFGKTILWDKSVDLTPSKIVTKGAIKKTPLWKTFAEDKPTKDMRRIIQKMDKQTIVTKTPPQVLELQQQMKGALDVQFTTPKTPVGKVYKVGQLSYLGLDRALMLQLGLGMKPRTTPRLDIGLDVKHRVKTVQEEILKQSPDLKTTPRTTQPIRTTPSVDVPPILKDPITKTPPAYKPPKFFFPPRIRRADLLKRRLKAMQRKDLDIFGALPDFTARALGIKPREVKGQKDAMRELRRIQTGIGIRKGVRVGRANIQEKDLLKGIMN